MTRPASAPGLRRRSVLTLAGLAVVALLLTLARVPLAQGGYVATVKDSNSAATNPYFTCAAAATGESGTKASIIYKMNETNGTSAVDSSGNSQTATYTNVGITYGVANSSPAVCPRDNTSVVTFDGSSGYAVGNNYSTGPTTFSEELWFKTSTIGGKLLGLGNAAPSAGESTSTYDRHIYMSNTGMIVFGYYDDKAGSSGTPYTIESPKPKNAKNYADGKWHHVVATFDTTSGGNLYMDGAWVGSNSHTGIEATSGYLHIAYDNLDGWPSKPDNYYFKGSIAYISIYNYVLTADQVAAHYRAGTGS